VSVTIKDVAKQANVSVATVSRALNGHENVAEAVRQRVLSVANELRYSPHHAARSLSSRRTHTIGVVLPDLYGEFFSELMRGIDHGARECGLHLLVSSYHGNPAEQGAALRAMRGRVDGLLVMSPFVGDTGMVRDNLSPGMPAVLMNSSLAETDLRAVSVDNYGGAREMVRHLDARVGEREQATQRHHVVGGENRIRAVGTGQQFTARAMAGSLVEVAFEDPGPRIGQARGEFVAIATQALGGVEIIVGA
jgi:DNA-binding LacI/PurR family transcriptional regulator